MIIHKIKEICMENNIGCFENEDLKKHCSFEIGGPANIFIEPKTEEDLKVILGAIKGEDIPVLVLGKGSNVLFSDLGYNGIIIHIGESFSDMKLINETEIYCQSGATLASLCRFAQENSLTGMEPLYGIPGSVGGAVYMNAGAYGGEMLDVLVSSDHISQEGDLGCFAGEDMQLAYRRSAYTDTNMIVTGCTVKLAKGDKNEIAEKMEDFMGRRISKQPLDYPSAGSTFKRPVGGYASALIDQSGLKNCQIGGAQVSGKHAGFIINAGGATCQDVLNLIEYVQKEVKCKTGFELEPEVKLIGKKKDD